MSFSSCHYKHWPAFVHIASSCKDYEECGVLLPAASTLGEMGLGRWDMMVDVKRVRVIFIP